MHLTSASEICLGFTVLKLWILLLSKLLRFETMSNSITVMNQSNSESKEIHSSKMVNLRQISLPEVRGNERFFKVKVLSDFDFGDFWKNWSQPHLVAKQLQKSLTCGKLRNIQRYQKYVRLVRAFFLEFCTCSSQQWVVSELSQNNWSM